jgi:hypothetical protein
VLIEKKVAVFCTAIDTYFPQLTVSNCLTMLNLACKYDLKILKAAVAEKLIINRVAVLQATEGNVADLIPDVPLLARELLGLT